MSRMEYLQSCFCLGSFELVGALGFLGFGILGVSGCLLSGSFGKLGVVGGLEALQVDGFRQRAAVDLLGSLRLRDTGRDA